MSPLRPHRGFTLLELLVTIAVMTIVLSVGLPAASEMKRSAEMTAAQNTLIAAIGLARQEAVKTGLPTKLVSLSQVNGLWDTGWEVVRESDGGQQVLMRFADIPPAVRVRSGGPREVSFLPLGSVSGGQCFDVISGDEVESVALSRAGRARACGVGCAEIASNPSACN